VLSDILRLDRHRARIGEDVRQRGGITAVMRMSHVVWGSCGGRVGVAMIPDGRVGQCASWASMRVPPSTCDAHHMVIARARLGTSRLAGWPD
ncbi:MAG: hypothetical protein KAS72_12375, partial [Phycisphaerales bacterium]|nr:hypothetical protein [Phycisphaerales bacterium]